MPTATSERTRSSYETRLASKLGRACTWRSQATVCSRTAPSGIRSSGTRSASPSFTSTTRLPTPNPGPRVARSVQRPGVSGSTMRGVVRSTIGMVGSDSRIGSSTIGAAPAGPSA